MGYGEFQRLAPPGTVIWRHPLLEESSPQQRPGLLALFPSGQVLVLEELTLRGRLAGNLAEEVWTLEDSAGRQEVPNPIRVLARQLKLVERILAGLDLPLPRAALLLTAPRSRVFVPTPPSRIDLLTAGSLPGFVRDLARVPHLPAARLGETRRRINARLPRLDRWY